MATYWTHERRIRGTTERYGEQESLKTKPKSGRESVYVLRHGEKAPSRSQHLQLFEPLEKQNTPCSPPTQAQTQPSKSSSSDPAPPARPQTSHASPAPPTPRTRHAGAVSLFMGPGRMRKLREGKRIGGGILVLLLGRRGVMGGRGE